MSPCAHERCITNALLGITVGAVETGTNRLASIARVFGSAVRVAHLLSDADFVRVLLLEAFIEVSGDDDHAARAHFAALMTERTRLGVAHDRAAAGAGAHVCEHLRAAVAARKDHAAAQRAAGGEGT